MSGGESAPLGWVAIDFLCCLLLVVYTLIAPPRQPTPRCTALRREILGRCRHAKVLGVPADQFLERRQILRHPPDNLSALQILRRGHS